VVQDKTINRRLEQIQQGVMLTEDAGILWNPFNCWWLLEENALASNLLKICCVTPELPQ
jgi:hypothetical protein